MEMLIMEKQLKIIYHYHSGFSVQVGGTLLVFDYWEGEDRSLAQVGRINPQFLSAFEKIYVFISHSHQDHLDPIVYMWENEGLPITYIVSEDVPGRASDLRILPRQEIQLDDQIESLMLEAVRSATVTRGGEFHALPTYCYELRLTGDSFPTLVYVGKDGRISVAVELDLDHYLYFEDHGELYAALDQILALDAISE
jgi:L-ascorbate metabolism protein UlaG (beta-lactamase superfamily)